VLLNNEKSCHEISEDKIAVCEKTAGLIEWELFGSNRRKRVKLRSNYPSWENISAGIPQGSILGPLLFNIFMNDLAYVIKHSKLSAYADDTQISYADKDPAKVEEVINSDLAKVDQWYKENRMQRNLYQCTKQS
jgi:retron-type reverse transcriptase